MNFIGAWLAAHQHAALAEADTQIRRQFPSATDGPAIRTPVRPRRLLEILQDQQVRLVRDSPRLHKAPYIALSYCWHSTQNCTLETDTLPLYKYGVAFQNLPPTIRDALQVTQTLGFQYLWVDALCIMQDSEIDKTEQLADMQSIYAGAAFVIAAAAAVDSSQRFLVDQVPQTMSACLLNVFCDPARGAGEDLAASAKVTDNAIVAVPCQKLVNSADYELSLSRLKSRGWVYQEEELAARVVYFCDRQLVLRCNLCHRTAYQQYLPQIPVRKMPNTVWPRLLPGFSAVASSVRALRALRACILRRKSQDLDLDKLAARYLETGARSQLSTLEGHRTTVDDVSLPNTPHERWWLRVEEYSSRHLSYSADKLPAVQGLANRFQSEFLASQNLDDHPDPVRYVFGLWSGDALAMGLLWYVKDGITTRPESRAPSWTWAAVDGVIGNNSVNGHAHPDACGLSVLKTPNPPNNRLVLRARVKPATWHRAPDDGKMYYVGHRRHGIVRFQHDLGQYEPLTADLSQGTEMQLLRDLSGRHVGYLIFDSGNELPAEGTEIYCLKIVVKPATRKDERDFNVPWATRGLALSKDRKDPSVFRRIGYIELHRTPGGISYPSSFNPAKQKAERNPPPNIDVAGFFDDCVFTNVTIV